MPPVILNDQVPCLMARIWGGFLVGAGGLALALLLYLAPPPVCDPSARQLQFLPPCGVSP